MQRTWHAGLIFAALILSTYGLPILLGFTGSPAAQTELPRDLGLAHRRPAFPVEFDEFTALYYTEPVNVLLREFYARGELPLWNPYTATGMPLAADLESKAFFPLQIVQVLLPHWTWDGFQLLRIWIAGMFMYFFLRRSGLEFLSAVFGGAAFCLSGAFGSYLRMEEITNEVMLLPVLVYTAHRLSAEYRLRNLFYYAAGVALAVYAGQPELGFLSAGVSWFFFIAQSSNLRWNSLKAAARSSALALLPLVLAAALAFPQIALSVQNLRWSYIGYLHQSLEAVQADLRPSLLTRLLAARPGPAEYIGNLITIVFPYYWGSTGWPWSDRIFNQPGKHPHPAMLGFMVLVGLALAVFSYRSASRSGRFNVLFWGTAGFILLSIAYGFPLTRWLVWIPPLRNMGFVRYYAPIFIFSCSVIAAFGVQWLSQMEDPALRRKLLLRALALSSAASVLLIAGGLGLHWQILTTTTARIYALYSIFARSLLVFFALAVPLFLASREKEAGRTEKLLLILLACELSLQVLYGLDLLREIFRLGLFLIAATSTCFWRARWPQIALAGLAIYLAGSALILRFSPHGLPERFDFTRHPPPYVEFLRQKDARQFRTYGIQAPTYANANFPAVHGFSDIRAVAPFVPVDWARFFSSHLSPTQSISQFQGWVPGRSEQEFYRYKKFYDYLGVKYILTNKQKTLDGGVKLIYNRELRVFENSSAHERASFIYDVKGYRLESDLSKELERADLRRTAWINEKDNPSDAGAGSTGAAGSATIREYAPRRVRIDAQTNAPGLLVLTDTYFPGWRCRVNGKRQEILRVNGLVRGVWLAAGTHEVVFEYY